MLISYFQCDNCGCKSNHERDFFTFNLILNRKNNSNELVSNIDTIEYHICKQCNDTKFNYAEDIALVQVICNFFLRKTKEAIEEQAIKMGVVPSTIYEKLERRK